LTIQSPQFPSDEFKIRFVGTLLSNEALAWYRTIIETHDPILKNCESFIAQFRSYLVTHLSNEMLKPNSVSLDKVKGLLPITPQGFVDWL
jgi:hypothetical protein